MGFKRKLFLLTLIMVLLSTKISYGASDVDFSIGKAILKLIFYTITFVFVIAVTIYGTRFIAKNTKKFVNSKYMRIIDTINFNANAKLAIVEINKIIYVFAITNNNIEIVDKYSEGEFNFEKDLNFERQLDKYKDRLSQDNNYINKLKIKISKTLNKFNKFIDKEDENDEKKY